jgi:IS5 family transposase
MKPQKNINTSQIDLFRSRLESIIDMRHELVILANKIDWNYLDQEFGQYYANFGRPGASIRLMIGLHLLKYIYALSDEVVCQLWRENPYYQYFCGEEYFQHKFPIERSSMSHFRDRVGDQSLEKLLQESLRIAYNSGALRIEDTERVAIDTTVQEKAISYPTDSKLRYKAIKELAKLAKEHGLNLRQSYLRVGKVAVMMSGRYRHAKQMKRAKKCERKLKTWLGRIIRDTHRKIEGNESLEQKFASALSKATKIWHQQKHDNNKLLSWHAPEVECISKGKTKNPYEFGCKVSVATNVNPAPGGNFIFHIRAIHGNPYDGHTLGAAVADIERIIGKAPNRIYVDKGYQGHNYEEKHQVFKSGQKRGVNGQIKRELRRRTVIEPIIGHIKSDCLLARNHLHKAIGDRVNALFAGIGYNFRRILSWIRRLCSSLLQIVIFFIKQQTLPQYIHKPLQ